MDNVDDKEPMYSLYTQRCGTNHRYSSKYSSMTWALKNPVLSQSLQFPSRSNDQSSQFDRMRCYAQTSLKSGERIFSSSRLIVSAWMRRWLLVHSVNNFRSRVAKTHSNNTHLIPGRCSSSATSNCKTCRQHVCRARLASSSATKPNNFYVSLCDKLSGLKSILVRSLSLLP